MPKQTPLQKKAVDSIMSQMEFYLDMRFQQVARINPETQQAWEDVVWQELTRLRATLSLDKPYGPVRLHIAQLFLSDDQKKIHELLMPKGQYSLLGEIVEEREQAGKKTEGQLEIHDMRTLFRAIDPKTECLITLVQTYIWWDFPDAILIAKFGWKSDRVRQFLDKGITEEMGNHYMELMAAESRPQADDVINYELRMLERVLIELRMRRQEERGYQVVVRRDPTQGEDPDQLITAIASQTSLLRNIEQGHDLDEALAEKFAAAMKITREELTPARAASFLTETVTTNKRRLKSVLNGQGSGELYNVKLRQFLDLEKKFKDLVGNRDYADKNAVAPSPATNA